MAYRVGEKPCVAETVIDCEAEPLGVCHIEIGEEYIETTWGLNPPPYRYCKKHYEELANLD